MESSARSTINLEIAGKKYTDPWFRDVAWSSLVNNTASIVEGGDGENYLIKIDDLKRKAGGLSFGGGNLSTWRGYPDKNIAMQLNFAEN